MICDSCSLPLVSSDVWDAAIAIALRRNRISATSSRRSYLLRLLIHCGICGLAFCGTWARSKPPVSRSRPIHEITEPRSHRRRALAGENAVVLLGDLIVRRGIVLTLAVDERRVSGRGAHRPVEVPILGTTGGSCFAHTALGLHAGARSWQPP